MPKAYLITHPPRYRQFRRPRRAKPSGLIVVHTAENAPDLVGEDGSAEALARFIQGRTSYGSYHRVSDRDSSIQLVPYDAEAYGDGTGSNPFAIHISSATQAHMWPKLKPEQRDQLVRRLAKDAAHAARWLKRHHQIVVPARRVTRAESEARQAGFISHGERDPGRRSDPGPGFPWDDFLRYFRQETQATRIQRVRQLLAEAIAAPANRNKARRLRKLRAAREQLPRR